MADTNHRRALEWDFFFQRDIGCNNIYLVYASSCTYTCHGWSEGDVRLHLWAFDRKFVGNMVNGGMITMVSISV